MNFSETRMSQPSPSPFPRHPPGESVALHRAAVECDRLRVAGGPEAVALHRAAVECDRLSRPAAGGGWRGGESDSSLTCVPLFNTTALAAWCQRTATAGRQGDTAVAAGGGEPSPSPVIRLRGQHHKLATWCAHDRQRLGQWPLFLTFFSPL